MATIPLSNVKDRLVIVDDVNEAKARQHNWQLIKPKHSESFNIVGSVDGRLMKLSHFLLRPPEGMHVLFLNWDRLDHREENMRIATLSLVRSRKRLHNKHGYKGVVQQGKRYCAIISFQNVVHKSRSFKTPVEAAREYDRMAREFYGPYADVNFPEEGEQDTRVRI